MKKLLTIMVLALALCLVCGVALAGTEDNMNGYTETQIKAFVTAGKLPDNTVIYGSDLDEVKLASAHNVEAAVKVYTKADKSTFKLVTVNVNPHVAGAYTITVNETCIADGEEATKCTVCGETMTRVREKFPAGTHTVAHGDLVYKTVVDPTCSDSGVARQYCKICKVWIPDSDSELAPTHEHTWVDKIVVMPTCKADGKMEWACKYCGINFYSFKDGVYKDWAIDIATFNANAYFVGQYGTIDGHDWVNWVDSVPATCLKDATQIRWCSRCELKEERTVANTKLSPVWACDVDPESVTCQTAAVTWTCSICKGANPLHKNVAGFGPDAYGKFESPDKKVSVKQNHVYDEGHTANYEKTGSGAVKVYKQADRAGKLKCTEGDYKRLKCELCATYKKVYVSEAPGHTWSAWQCVSKPGASGNTDGLWNRTCKVCGEAVSFTGPKQPPEMCTEHVPVLDEEWSYEPDCEFPGMNFYVCANCGIDLDDLAEEVPALGHDWDVTVKKAATCTEEGLNNRVCKRCGIGETDVPAEKLPHDYDEGVITKEATLTEKGVKTFTCKACGATKTEEVDFVPAEPAKYEMTAAYDGKTVSGKLVHDPTTVKADEKFVRVTFYVEGNYYMATMAEVNADGTFSVDGVGPIVYITVAATTNSAVNPEAYVAIATPIEIEVK